MRRGKTGFLLLVLLAAIVLAAGLFLIGKAYVDTEALLSQQAVMAQVSPQPSEDNTKLWIGLLSVLGVQFILSLPSMFSTYMNYRLQRDMKVVKSDVKGTKEAVEENTVITKEAKEIAQETKTDINGRMTRLLSLEKEKSRDEGMKDQREIDRKQP